MLIIIYTLGDVKLTEAPTTESGQIFCVVCGRTTGVEQHDGLAACRSHFGEVFAQCSECGEYVDAEKVEIWKRDNSFSESNDGIIYCKACADRRSRSNPNSHWLHCDWEAMESSHAVGVEIECINNSNKSIETIFREHAEQMRFFSQHHDGSVTGGLELVSSPIPMSKFKKLIRKCKWMERTLKVDSSCGLHVHFNMRPWIVYDEADLEELGQILQKLTIGLLKIENYIYKTQPMSRRPGSHGYSYCRKIKEAVSSLNGLSIEDMERMTGTEFAKIYFKNETRHGNTINEIGDLPRVKMSIRYCWANLSAITMHDTIEFRVHSGTTCAKKIEMWVRCLDKIMSHILDSTLEELRDFGPHKLHDILDEDEMAYLNERIERFSSRSV